MECFNCGCGAGVACSRCERAVCGRKTCGYFRYKGVITCFACREEKLRSPLSARVAPIGQAQTTSWTSPYQKLRCSDCGSGAMGQGEGFYVCSACGHTWPAPVPSRP